MSAKVDVLAVMQRAGRELDCVGTRASAPIAQIEALAVEVDEARAAVAELIEAAEALELELRGGWYTPRRLIAALAACGAA